MNSELTGKKKLICDTIANQQLIKFKYKDRFRLVEPYCCGIGNSDNYLLRAFQIEGFAADDKSPSSWRLFELDDMSEVAITDKHFDGKRRYYNPKDPAMKKIFCNVHNIQ